MVLAGCTPAYAPVVRAAMLALCSSHFNLNGIQATTHMAAPLLVVNGPVRAAIGMNAGANVFGSGNRANATIGRAIRLVLLNVGGAWPGDLDKSTLGHPGKYSFCIAENEDASPCGEPSRCVEAETTPRQSISTQGQLLTRGTDRGTSIGSPPRTTWWSPPSVIEGPARRAVCTTRSGWKHAAFPPP